MSTRNRVSKILRAVGGWFAPTDEPSSKEAPIAPETRGTPNPDAGEATRRDSLPALPPSLTNRRVDGWEVPPPAQLIAISDDVWMRGEYFELALLDASESMFKSADGPRRIDILLTEFGRYAERLRNCGSLEARLGVIWFSRAAFLGLPWTDQLGGLQDKLMQSLPVPGSTNFAGALRAGYAMLTARTFPPGAVVVVRLFSDGQHLDDDEPTPIARLVKELGVIVHTVGCASSTEDLDTALLRHISSRDEEGYPLYRFVGDQDGLRTVLDAAAEGLGGPRP